MRDLALQKLLVLPMYICIVFPLCINCNRQQECQAFSSIPVRLSHRYHRGLWQQQPTSTSQLHNIVWDDSEMESVLISTPDFDCIKADESNDMYKSLQARQKELSEGVGKRYICRTMFGFLNIHKEPGNPFNTDNIIGRLVDGDVVTSTGPKRGSWVQHAGGWSISKYEGFTWLEAIDDEPV